MNTWDWDESLSDSPVRLQCISQRQWKKMCWELIILQQTWHLYHFIVCNIFILLIKVSFWVCPSLEYFGIFYFVWTWLKRLSSAHGHERWLGRLPCSVPPITCDQRDVSWIWLGFISCLAVMMPKPVVFSQRYLSTHHLQSALWNELEL